MQRSYYQSSIEEFLSITSDEILGKITQSERIFNITPKSTSAWLVEIEQLKNTLKNFQGYIHFEFVIPRMGKRADVVLIIENVIFILEYKAGSDDYDAAAINQATDYALDLKNFHEGSHQQIICPILIASESENEEYILECFDDLIYKTLRSNGLNISSIINDVLSDAKNKTNNINHELWLNSSYKPTPNIIEAAQALYEGNKVEEISRSDAGARNLSITSDAIANIITKSKTNNEKAIIFVTGVAGAGKTLVGLNIATDKSKAIGLEKETVYLSGNQPLVDVLSEALARDKIKNLPNDKKQSKDSALREVKKFIQIVHHFRDEYINNQEKPFEKVVVFDESQRAWDQQKLSSWMKTKKGKNIEMSEPDLLISVLNRHKDWCVIVCLVGGGQEINSGEAGLSTWIKSIDESYLDWKVYLSDQIDNKEYSWGYDFSKVFNSTRTSINPDLHLSVSLRSFRSENLSNYINAIIDCDINKALTLKESLKDYPLKITRNLDDAKRWLRETARGSERYGLVAQTSDRRLKAEGIFVKEKIDAAHWFLDDSNDIRSSFFLEDVATEFEIQGLELDWVGVCWDGSMRKSENGWDLYKFSGSSYQKRNSLHDQKYLLNAFRVLLTRARQGLIVFIPKGDNSDHTRLTKFYDPTYEYLIKCGFALI